MDRLFATITFFTRVPLWRLRNIPADAYRRVVELWPLAGWLTGGAAAVTLFIAAQVWAAPIAVTMGLCARLLLTGALHEDGLADFIDGMGGGTDRERILAIMKDSHIGTYGVIGLTIYIILSILLLSTVPPVVAALLMLCADPWSKCCAAQVINFLPYARTAEQAKNKTVYTRMSAGAIMGLIATGLIPTIIIFSLSELPAMLLYGWIAPVVTVAAMIAYMHYKIQGYTGDCCGATALLAELSLYITTTALWK